jgi:hypothetical protein
VVCARLEGMKLVVVLAYVNAVIRWRHQKSVLAVNRGRCWTKESVLLCLNESYLQATSAASAVCMRRANDWRHLYKNAAASARGTGALSCTGERLREQQGGKPCRYRSLSTYVCWRTDHALRPCNLPEQGREPATRGGVALSVCSVRRSSEQRFKPVCTPLNPAVLATAVPSTLRRNY